MVPVSYFIGLSAILFTIGALGVLVRRNPIVIFMSIELMLNSANLAFVTFARMHGAAGLAGQIFVFFVMTVAAAEVAVGLALIVAIFRTKQSIDVDQMDLMKG